MNARPVYLDNQATTQVDRRVLEVMLPYLLDEFGNPASPNVYGYAAAKTVTAARAAVRDMVGASRDSEIVFTSGATEANHLALTGVANALRGKGNHLITTAIEHKSILATCDQLAAVGFRITRIPVSSNGRVSPADIEAAITPGTVLVSVMHGNNEIGTIQPLAAIAAITRVRGLILHTDAAQSIGSIAFDADDLGVDMASFSAHKIYGPKGVGALYVRHGTTRPIPQIVGGSQEFGLRAGTPNVPGIAGFGQAARILGEDRDRDAARIRSLREQLYRQLTGNLAHCRVNGDLDHRLPGNLNITIPGVEADDLLAALPGLAMSTGSACSTGSPEPSHVLVAIGLTRAEARATVRISIGRFTTPADIDYAAGQIVGEIRRRLGLGDR